MLSRSVIQIRRTTTANSPPTDLEVGELGVELASTPARLWVGYPAAPNGRLQLNAAGGGGATVADTAPATAAQGDLWFNSLDVQLYIRYGTQWVVAVNLIGPEAELDGGTW